MGWLGVVVDHVLGLLVVYGGAQGSVEWASEGVKVVGVPVWLVLLSGWGRGPGLVWEWLHKGIGGNGCCHGGLMKVGMFDVVPGV